MSLSVRFLLQIACWNSHIGPITALKWAPRRAMFATVSTDSQPIELGLGAWKKKGWNFIYVNLPNVYILFFCPKDRCHV